MDGLRQCPRMTFSGEVSVSLESGETYVLDALDVSSSGVFLRSSLLMMEGEPCSLSFELEGQAIRGRGRVSRTQGLTTGRRPFGMAITFVELEDGAERVLKRAIQPVLRNAAV